MIECADDGDAGKLLGGILHTLHALLQVGCVLTAGNDRDTPLAPHLLAQLLHNLRSHQRIIATVEREALGVGNVTVKGHHRHATIDRFVHGADELSCVARREENRVRTAVHRLRDLLRLHRAILVGRCEPVDLHIHAGRLGDFRRGRLGANASREEDRIRRTLRDERDGEGLAVSCLVGFATAGKRRGSEKQSGSGAI